MHLRVGYELIYDCPQPTPMMLMVNIHHSRANDIVRPDLLQTTPAVPSTTYRDGFGNWCTRLVVPRGRTVLSANAQYWKGECQYRMGRYKDALDSFYNLISDYPMSQKLAASTHQGRTGGCRP